MPRLRLPPPLLLLFVLLFLVPAAASASCCDVDVDGPPSREFFPMDGDVAWIVQVSDLHLSAFHHDRARDLEDLLAPALRVVRPALLLVTGDITDAKNKDRTSTRQDESEWVQYWNSMDTVVRKSGIDKRRIFDIRGNHDKYGVPCVGDKLDFFSVYSISAQLNRTSTIQSISLVHFTILRFESKVTFEWITRIFGSGSADLADPLDAKLIQDGPGSVFQNLKKKQKRREMKSLRFSRMERQLIQEMKSLRFSRVEMQLIQVRLPLFGSNTECLGFNMLIFPSYRGGGSATAKQGQTNSRSVGIG